MSTENKRPWYIGLIVTVVTTLIGSLTYYLDKQSDDSSYARTVQTNLEAQQQNEIIERRGNNIENGHVWRSVRYLKADLNAVRTSLSYTYIDEKRRVRAVVLYNAPPFGDIDLRRVYQGNILPDGLVDYIDQMMEAPNNFLLTVYATDSAKLPPAIRQEYFEANGVEVAATKYIGFSQGFREGNLPNEVTVNWLLTVWITQETLAATSPNYIYKKMTETGNDIRYDLALQD